MRDVLREALTSWQSSECSAMATVVATHNSAPRLPGATMLVGSDGRAFGSVSGGCVEAAVYDLADEVIRSRTPVLERYGVSDESAFAVGLSCGGTLEIFVEPVDKASFPEFEGVAQDITDGRPVAVATVIDRRDDTMFGRRLVVRPIGSTRQIEGSLGSPHLDSATADAARDALEAGHTGILDHRTGTQTANDLRIFVATYRSAPRMLVFGAIDFAAAVSRAAAFLGYRVTVCDARATFATTERFPTADEVVVDWPHRYLAAELEAGAVDSRTVICVLTHDQKFDQPLLTAALQVSSLAYIGAMGSRRTHAERLAGLRSAGLDDEQLRRLHSPIGLDLGARTPEETAISIMAEIIAARTGASGRSLRELSGPLHVGGRTTSSSSTGELARSTPVT
ncbi:XdhC/CoxI family protein [Kribbella sp. NPDC051936]|uniref:XdhC/CoxI family protein n=1 Tax=Kribbella sp. NPDC051936 TaxID=3154946 RepID=UPI00342D85D5